MQVALSGRLCRCGKPARARGKCGACYQKLRRSLGLHKRPAAIKGYGAERKIESGVHPLVRQFFNLLQKDRVTVTLVAERAGVSRHMIEHWARYSRGSGARTKRASTPSIATLEACLGVLGYRLCIREAGE